MVWQENFHSVQNRIVRESLICNQSTEMPYRKNLSHFGFLTEKVTCQVTPIDFGSHLVSYCGKLALGSLCLKYLSY